MQHEELKTEQYLDNSPEHERFLKRANRRRFKSYEIRRALVKGLIITSVLIVGGLMYDSYTNSASSSSGSIRVHLIRTIKSMIGELNQEEKIWDSI